MFRLARSLSRSSPAGIQCPGHSFGYCLTDIAVDRPPHRTTVRSGASTIDRCKAQTGWITHPRCFSTEPSIDWESLEGLNGFGRMDESEKAVRFETMRAIIDSEKGKLLTERQHELLKEMVRQDNEELDKKVDRIVSFHNDDYFTDGQISDFINNYKQEIERHNMEHGITEPIMLPTIQEVREVIRRPIPPERQEEYRQHLRSKFIEQDMEQYSPEKWDELVKKGALDLFESTMDLHDKLIAKEKEEERKQQEPIRKERIVAQSRVITSDPPPTVTTPHSKRHCRHIYEECQRLLSQAKTDREATLREATALAKEPRAHNVQIDLASYAALLRVFEECGEPVETCNLNLGLTGEDAERLEHEMEDRQLKPHHRVLAGLLQMFILVANTDAFERIIQYAMRLGYFVGNVLQVVNMAISGALVFGDARTALYLYDLARQSHRFRANSDTLRLVLIACDMLKNSKRALRLLDEFEEWDVKPDTSAFNVLFGSIMQTSWPEGFFAAEKRFLESGEQPNDGIWNARILGNACYDTIDKGVSLVYEMKKSGVSPNDATLASLLLACHRDNNIQEAVEVFYKLKGEVVDINEKHFAMLLQLAAKAKNQEKFEEVVRLVQRSPFAKDESLNSIIGWERSRLNIEQPAAAKIATTKA